MSYQKPFLKWVGGKTQMIDLLMQKFPKHVNNYHELFLGGGSVLFAFLTLVKNNKITINGKIYAYDLNNDLINIYKQIQSNKDKFYDYTQRIIKEYDSIGDFKGMKKPTTKQEALTSKESYYYWIRHKYNSIKKNTAKHAAIFLFLNKIGFRGMYREGPNGFNVPFGHYKKTPVLINKQELDKISFLIQDVVFTQSNFINSIQNCIEGDFVYLDPPYVPENKTSFVGYTSGGFDMSLHMKLFDAIIQIYDNNVKFLMSNAKVSIVIDKFSDPKFTKEDVIARRSINSKNPAAKTTEIMIFN
jgi:DNA adenine methylase